ncbi:glycosyl transferase [Bradyrhizobium vignae]|nr:glycosyl transferase [Bradyrhizobium vignae]
MMERVYCTCFDRNYLSRGLALYHSLRRHAPGSRLWVLCLDQVAYQLLRDQALPDLIPVQLSDFETADPDVAATRAIRSLVEYYFTLCPAWLLYVAQEEAGAEWVTYLDSDLFFFGSPELIYEELGGAAFAIIPHRYPPALERLKRFGIYNVGWVGARTDPDGLAPLRWWRAKCIEWCCDYVDGERFADQGYLQELARRFSRVKAIENPGANLAPWNLTNYQIGFRAPEILINDAQPLIFFHFQGVKRGFGCFIFNNHRNYAAPFTGVVRKHIYKPYVDEILKIEQGINPSIDVSDAKPLARADVDAFWPRLENMARKARNRSFQMLDIVTGRAFLVLRGKAY